MKPLQGGFLGFYTFKPFWAINPITPEEFPAKGKEITLSFEHSEYTLAIRRDGLVLLQIRDLEDRIASLEWNDYANLNPIWNKYFNSLNCLYLLLDSLVLDHLQVPHLKIQQINYRMAQRLEFAGGVIQSQSHPILTFPVPHWNAALELPVGRDPLGLPEFSWRLAIPSTVFEGLDIQFQQAFANSRLIGILSQMAKSVAEFKDTNFSITLVLAWFVTEGILRDMWKGLLDRKNIEYPDGSKRISKDRRKNLINGSNYTASVISSFLELSDVVPFELFKLVDATRNVRNDIVHDQVECSRDDCVVALKAIENLLELHYKFKLKLNYVQAFTMPK